MKTLFKTTGIVISIFMFVSHIFAQSCTMYHPTKVGTITEITSYDKKGKPRGTRIYTEVLKAFDSIGYNVEKLKVWTVNKKHKSSSPITYYVMCKGNEFLIDTKSYLNTQDLGKYTDFDIKVESQTINVPTHPFVGQKLRDGVVKAKFLNKNITLMTLVFKMKNRKVDAIEKITTPAGTFKAIKISYDFEMKMGLKFRYKGVEWYAKDVGIVRSELWNKKGTKLKSYQEITKIIEK